MSVYASLYKSSEGKNITSLDQEVGEFLLMLEDLEISTPVSTISINDIVELLNGSLSHPSIDIHPESPLRTALEAFLEKYKDQQDIYFYYV